MYINPAGRARDASVALIAYMAALAANMGAALLAPRDSMPVAVSGVVLLGTYVVAMIVTGRWIYRVTANARGFAGDLPITPGWAVGWFFIPIANLWKPSEALREVWRASSGGDLVKGSPPAYFNLWWACWIIGNLLANVSFQAERMTHDPTLVNTFDLLSSGVSVLAAGSMLFVIARLSALQPRMHAAITFS